ncbi:MAG: hypothetical protein LBI33_12930 [Propionibacteriaceae bacterium]|jgi:hypothetical protein|nr:hypothetical protein [Propionibacteriaceae bacterium]
MADTTPDAAQLKAMLDGLFDLPDQDDQTVVDTWTGKAPKPDMALPRNRRFLSAIVAFVGQATKGGGTISLPVAITLSADLDELFARILGEAWTEFIRAVPAEYQDSVVLQLGWRLSRESGKG